MNLKNHPPITSRSDTGGCGENIESSLKAKQRESENLFNSLMQRAFKGELVS